MPPVVNKKKAVVPACKHCENLKLPSAHWLRSLQGTIVCPVLLSTECRYCHVTGHTVKSCPELAAKNTPTPKAEKMAPVRDFRVLQEADTDSDEESGRVFPEEQHVATASWNGKLSFAKVLMQTPPPSMPMDEDELVQVAYPSSPLSTPPYQPYFSRIAAAYANKSWADMSDSDDE